MRIDGELLREARETLGTRNNTQTVELAMTITLAVQEPCDGIAQKYLRRLRSRQFKI